MALLFFQLFRPNILESMANPFSQLLKDKQNPTIFHQFLQLPPKSNHHQVLAEKAAVIPKQTQLLPVFLDSQFLLRSLLKLMSDHVPPLAKNFQYLPISPRVKSYKVLQGLFLNYVFSYFTLTSLQPCGPPCFLSRDLVCFNFKTFASTAISAGETWPPRSHMTASSLL